MKFHEKLQYLRKEKGMSQEVLAERIGISRQAVAKWELSQTYPDIENLIALSNLFKISIDRLLKSEEDSCCYDWEHLTFENSISKELIDFLLKAKKVTYAGKGYMVDSSRPESHDHRYEEGDFVYLDSYFGGEKFSGEEAVWLQGQPIWSMNYCGRVLSEEFSGDFLKDALSLVPKEHPYRGPMLYQNGEYTYHCIINGKADWYQGYEEIYYNQKKVYECYFHGGIVR